MKITAHIPTQQFGFIELTELPDDVTEVERLYNKYAEKPIKLALGTSKRIKDFFGNEIDYDEVNHLYSWEGVPYLSGSVYAQSFKKPFDGNLIADKMAAKIGAKGSDILKMWSLKGDASRDFGNAVHKALQLYETYRKLSEALSKEYHIHDNFVLKDIVESFYKAHKDEEAHSEIVIVDHKAKHAGQVDRFVVTGDKKGFITDFKTGSVEKELDIYFKQLEFYGDIFKANGWTIEKPIIYGWNGKWIDYASPK